MHRLLLLLASLVLLQAIHVRATGYTIPNKITVNQPTELRINTGVEPDSELRKKFRGYRVFLAAEPPGWGLEPICWLVNDVPTDERNVTVTIPADVVPDNTKVHFSTGLIYKKDRGKVNGFDYSASTRLLGGNGTWSQRELDGWVIGDENLLSCWAFSCARACEDKYYTGDSSRSSDGTKDKEADHCVNDCARDFNPRPEGAGVVRKGSVIIATLVSTATIWILS